MMVDAHSPSLIIPPARRRLLHRRWYRWLPFLRIHLAATHEGWRLDHALSCVEDQHRRWFLSLLDAEIPMKIIERWQMDDPRLPESELRSRRDRYIKEREERRNGRSH